MRRSTCSYLIKSDVYRQRGAADLRSIVACWLDQPSMRLLIVFRIGRWARATPGHRIARAVTSVLHHRYSARYGIEIPFATSVGPGLKINHRVGGIVVNSKASIGAGVTLTPGVVIGNNAPDPTAPVIGDGVRINVGAKVIGGVVVGDGAQIGANAVVIRDVPAGRVVAGVPARVLEGSTPVAHTPTAFVDALGEPPADAV